MLLSLSKALLAAVVGTVISLILSCVPSGYLHAHENPFGLPLPEDLSKPGCVMLHGGGDGVTNQVREEFVKLAGGDRARIVIIPSDETQFGKDAEGEPLDTLETAEEYEGRLAQFSNYGHWVELCREQNVASFSFLYRIYGEDEESFYDRLENATGVWLPAYDQEWLPTEFAEEYPSKVSRFQIALRKIVARGGVVGGLGGGAAALPETIIAGDDSRHDGWVTAEIRFGLGLFNGAIVDNNFETRAGRLERLSNLLQHGPRIHRLKGQPGIERRTLGIGVERQTVAILRENALRVIGEGNVHVFLKSNSDRTITWRKIAPEDGAFSITAKTEPLVHPKDRKTVERKLDRNPFGMPEPNDPERWGTIVLHGGGNNDDIIDLYPSLAADPEPLLVHCPAALKSFQPSPNIRGRALENQLTRSFVEWKRLETQGRIKQLSFLTTSDPADANRESFVAPLTEAHALWFSGGDQRLLNQLFVDGSSPTLFQTETFKLLKRGGVVGGTSAGLAIMPSVMIEGGAPEDGRPAVPAIAHGLGVLKNVLAEQHFDARAGRIERLTRLLRNHGRLREFLPDSSPRHMIGLAVEEDTALILQANRLQVAGVKVAHVFLQGIDPKVITWHTLKPGDAAFINFDYGAYTLEIEEWSLQP